MTTEERLEKVEKRLSELDALLAKLTVVAAAHPLGRVLLRAAGLG